jgi:hypothetical protein
MVEFTEVVLIAKEEATTVTAVVELMVATATEASKESAMRAVVALVRGVTAKLVMGPAAAMVWREWS